MSHEYLAFDQKQKDDAIAFMTLILAQLGQYLGSAIRYINQEENISSDDIWAIIEANHDNKRSIHPTREDFYNGDPYVKLDTQAWLKYLVFAKRDVEKRKAQRMAFFKLANMEGDTRRQETYIESLRSMIGYRNLIAHTSLINQEKLSSATLQDFVAKVETVLSVLSETAWDKTNTQSVQNFCDQKRKEFIEKFKPAPIEVASIAERVFWRYGGVKEDYITPIHQGLTYFNFSVENECVYGVECMDTLLEKLLNAPSMQYLVRKKTAAPAPTQGKSIQSAYARKRCSPAQRHAMATAQPIMELTQKNLLFLLTEFTCVVEESMLLSPHSHNFFVTTLVPALRKWQTYVYVDESVVVSLFALFRSTAPYTEFELAYLDADEAKAMVDTRTKLHKEAKQGIKLLGYLREQGCLQVMSSLVVGGDSRKNLMALVERYTEHPILLLTLDRQLVRQISQGNNQHVLACKPTLDKELLFYRDTQRIFMSSDAHMNHSGEEVAESYPLSTAGNPVLWGDNREKLILGRAIGEGGEGIIYKTSNPTTVAKIYFPQNCTEARREKLDYMIAHNPCIAGLAWPTALVYDMSGLWVGFLMPHVEGAPLATTVFHPGRNCVNITRMGWNRWHLAQTAANVAEIFAQLHRHDILMADINPRNILVTPDCTVGFVDCDSYQIGDYDCPVGTPLYTPPEVHQEMQELKIVDYGYRRTIEHECYSVAVLLFEIMMIGKAPYESSNNDTADVVDAIIAGHFPYRFNDGTDSASVRFNIKVPVGKWRNIWSHMPWSNKKDFHDVFTGKRRLSAQSWQQSMSGYARLIGEKESSNELLPTGFKVIDSNNKFGISTNMVNLVCHDCKTSFNLGEDVYKKRKQYKEDTLCEHCRTMRKNLRNRVAHVVCTRCGVQFVKPAQQCIELAQRKEPILCDSCRSHFGSHARPR